MLLGTAFDISWFFQGLENFRVTVVRNVLVRIASLILIFLLVHKADDTAVYSDHVWLTDVGESNILALITRKSDTFSETVKPEHLAAY